MVWSTWKDKNEALQKSELKIRPKDFWGSIWCCYNVNQEMIARSADT